MGKVSQTDLVLLAGMGETDFRKSLGTMTLNSAMIWRRDIQQALAEYARHHGYDKVQAAALAMAQSIERSCWRTYWKRRVKELMRQDPNLVSKYGKTWKWHIRQEWDKMVKRASY